MLYTFCLFAQLQADWQVGGFGGGAVGGRMGAHLSPFQASSIIIEDAAGFNQWVKF